MIKKIAFILFALLLTAFTASADGFLFPYIVEVKTDEDMQISDSVFYKIARSVVFPVNKYDIPENSVFYKELVGQVIPDMNQRGYRLEAIAIRGAASPEGPYKWNEFLGEHRRKALFDLIDKNMAQPSCTDCMQQNDVPEDYRYLLYMMAEARDKDYARVKNLVDLHLDANVQLLKKHLMSLDRGTLWKRLLKQYFPELRAARVVLFFRQPQTIEAEWEPEHTNKPVSVSRFEVFEDDEELKLYNLPGLIFNLPPLEQPIIAPLDSIPYIVIPFPDLYRRELLSVKTNLLFDFAYMPGYNGFCPIPNVAVEYYPLHGHFTYGAMFDCPWWQGGTRNHKYFQIRNYTLESRYYFRSGDVRQHPEGAGAAFKGWYLSAYAHAFIYGIGWSDRKGFDYPGAIGGHGWQGEGIGGGLGFGYVTPLSRDQRWRLEFAAQVGFFRTKYDPYIYGCPVEQVNDGLYYYVWYRDADLFRERQYRFNWLGPTRISIQLSYDLLYRRMFKKGASFKRKEKGGAQW